jgi:hypothetical protein
VRNVDDDYAFHHNLQKFSGMDNNKFDDYVSVDSHLVTNGVNTAEELCASHMGAGSVEGGRRGKGR